jgi:hypothetical protein
VAVPTCYRGEYGGQAGQRGCDIYRPVCLSWWVRFQVEFYGESLTGDAVLASVATIVMMIMMMMIMMMMMMMM